MAAAEVEVTTELARRAHARIAELKAAFENEIASLHNWKSEGEVRGVEVLSAKYPGSAIKKVVGKMMLPYSFDEVDAAASELFRDLKEEKTRDNKSGLLFRRTLAEIEPGLSIVHVRYRRSSRLASPREYISLAATHVDAKGVRWIMETSFDAGWVPPDHKKFVEMKLNMHVMQIIPRGERNVEYISFMHNEPGGKMSKKLYNMIIKFQVTTGASILEKLRTVGAEPDVHE